MVVRRLTVRSEAEPGSDGLITAKRHDDEWEFVAAAGRHLPPADVELFVVWADEAIARLMEVGPAGDGWEPGDDGRWRRRVHGFELHAS